MYKQLYTKYIECDRWRGLARPRYDNAEYGEYILADPTTGIQWITRRSATGLTVGGHGVPVDWVEAVHWTKATQGAYVFFRGHGALGKGEPVFRVHLDPETLGDIIAEEIGAPSFEDGLRLLTTREWAERLARHHVPSEAADAAIARRRQWEIAVKAIKTRGFAHFARPTDFDRFGVGLCRARSAEVYHIDCCEMGLYVGFFYLEDDTFFHLDANGVYLGTADFWKSDEMKAVREDFPERLRTRWFGSE